MLIMKQWSKQESVCADVSDKALALQIYLAVFQDQSQVLVYYEIPEMNLNWFFALAP